MKRRVLIISQHFYPEIGSHANRMKYIYMLLKRHNFDVKILTTEPSYPNKSIYENDEFWDEESLNSVDNNIARIGIRNRKYSSSIINRLLYYLEIAYKFLLVINRDKEKYDYIFATSPPIFTGFVGLFAKYRYKSKLILDIRDLWPESLKGVGVFNNAIILQLFGLLEKLLYLKADQIVINSMGFKHHIQKSAGIDSSKIMFIPNGSLKEELSPERKVTKSKNRVIYAGNLGLAQNTELIYQLVPLLNERGIGLTIIGYGIKKNKLLNSIKKFKNVEIINPMTKRECFKIISDHDIGLVTLKDEEVFKTVLPGKIVDYMTCGVPIVGMIDGYAKDIVEKAGVGFASSSNDLIQILEDIEELLENDELRSQMSSKAQSLILSEYNWEKNIMKLVNYLH